MNRRLRLVMFGLAASLVLAGVVCAILVGGVAGEVSTIVLMSVGLGGGLLLVFFEIGASEERELARERERRDESERRMRQDPTDAPSTARHLRLRRSLGRQRGHLK
jgi:hypothetical protein